MGARYKHTKAEETTTLADLLELWGRRSEDERRLSAMVRQAAALLAVMSSELDSDLFNSTSPTARSCSTQNGTAIRSSSVPADHIALADRYAVFSLHSVADRPAPDTAT